MHFLAELLSCHQQKMFEDFSDFLKRTPTPYHYTQRCREILGDQGFTEMKESESWSTVPKKGYVIRDDRTIFAWNDNGHDRAVVVAAHDDFPCLILKQNFDQVQYGYRQARCSFYGGLLFHSWTNRQLKLVGRVLVEENGRVKTVLFDSEKAIACTPSLAVHFGTNQDTHPSFDYEMHSNIIYGRETDSPPLMEYVAKKIGVSVESIVDFDLRFIDSQEPGSLFDDLILAEGLDNRISTYCGLKAFLDATPEEGSISLYVSFDNEEIGSLTRVGAKNDSIARILKRITQRKEIRALKANSYILATDVLFGYHPLYPEIYESTTSTYIGRGLGMEHDGEHCSYSNPSQIYPVISACEKMGVNLQISSPKNNDVSGGTIAPGTETCNEIKTVDIGVPVSGMHSIREFASISDVKDLIIIFKELYEHISEHNLIQ